MGDMGEGGSVGYLTPGSVIPVEGDISASEANDGSSGGEIDVSSMGDDDLVALAEEKGFSFSDEGASREELEAFVKGEKEEEEEEVDESDIPEEAKLPKVSKELEKERMELQRLVGQKLQGIAQLRAKAQIIDAIEANPLVVIPELAKRFGIKLGGDPSAETSDKEPEPKSDETAAQYLARLVDFKVEQTLKRLGMDKNGQPLSPPKQLSPVQKQALAAKKYLDANHKDWQLYNEEMTKILRERPALLGRPTELYQEGKKMALAKNGDKRLKPAQKAEPGKLSTGVRGGSKVKLNPSGAGKKLTFNESWDLAKRQAREGK